MRHGECRVSQYDCGYDEGNSVPAQDHSTTKQLSYPPRHAKHLPLRGPINRVRIVCRYGGWFLIRLEASESVTKCRQTFLCPTMRDYHSPERSGERTFKPSRPGAAKTSKNRLVALAPHPPFNETER